MKKMLSGLRTAALVLAATAAGAGAGYAQHQLPDVPPERLPTALPIQAPTPGVPQVGVLPVQGRVYMLNLGGELNIVAQVGDDGILLVDTGPAEWTERILQTLGERFGDKPIRYIINTHPHPDHVGGNAAMMRAGRPSGSTEPAPAPAGGPGGGAGGGGGGGGGQPRLIAHENAYNWMAGTVDHDAEFPPEALPTSTFFTAKKEIYFNGEPIEILFQPAAHTDGDLMVWFRSSDVLAVGDLFSTVSYPVIDEKHGGTLQGHLNALNRMLDITVPRFNQMGGTMVIPGRGRLSNESDVDDYRNWMTIVRDRVQEMINNGMTLAQIKAAKPTLDFDGVFDSPHWTPEMFLEAVYRDLSRNARPAQSTRTN